MQKALQVIDLQGLRVLVALQGYTTEARLWKLKIIRINALHGIPRAGLSEKVCTSSVSVLAKATEAMFAAGGAAK
jgi:hypothetical protein